MILNVQMSLAWLSDYIWNQLGSATEQHDFYLRIRKWRIYSLSTIWHTFKGKYLCTNNYSLPSREDEPREGRKVQSSKARSTKGWFYSLSIEEEQSGVLFTTCDVMAIDSSSLLAIAFFSSASLIILLTRLSRHMVHCSANLFNEMFHCILGFRLL